MTSVFPALDCLFNSRVLLHLPPAELVNVCKPAGWMFSVIATRNLSLLGKNDFTQLTDAFEQRDVKDLSPP